MVSYLCPTDKKYACSWEGSSDDILEHFINEHEDLLYYSNHFHVELFNYSENRLLFFDEEIYLVQTKVQEDSLRIYLRYLGPQKIASKISYDIDINSNSTFLDKTLITISPEGCFVITLDSLKQRFGDTDQVNCRLLISGDFKSHSSDDGVFLDCESAGREKDDPIFSKVPFFSKQYSPDLDRRSLQNFTEIFEQSTSPLTRSQTISSEDMRKRTVIKRCHSTVSLESIPETEAELNCANCDVILVPPVYLCPGRHNFFAQCSENQCKLCGENVTNKRNIDIEEKCSKHEYTCRNKKNGCTKKLLYKDLNEHEINCKFCEYKCPMDECNFTDQFKNMYKHLKLIHSSVKIFETPILVFNKNNQAFLINPDKGIFFCEFTIVNNENVVWKAKFCGPKERRFFCELKFKEKNLKQPLLLRKIEETYSLTMSAQDLKRLKVKSKNAILTITC